MAVTGVATGSTGGNVVTITLAWSALTATPQANDVAYLIWTCGSAQTVTTDPAGWTLEGTRDSTNGSLRTRIYSRVCTGSESGSISATASATNRQTLTVRVLRGVNTSSPVHKIAFLDETAAVASHACPAVTPTLSSCVILALLGERSSTGSTSLSTPGGSTYTVRVHSGSAGAGSGGTFSGIADDLASPHPANAAVTPDNLVGSASIIGVTTWTLAIPAASVAATGTATDTLGLAENTGRGTTAARTLAESLSVADAPAATSGRARAAADAVTLADQATRAGSMARGAADALTAADAATPITAATRPAFDTLSFGDTSGRATATARTTADVLTLADAADRASALVVSASDALTPSDDASGSSSQSRTAGDAVALVDAAGALRAVQAAAADTLTLSETATGTTTAAPPPGIPGEITVNAATAALAVAASSSLTATATRTRMEVTAR